MKKLDKYIIISLITIAALAVVYGLSASYVLTMQILGGIILFGYFIFITFHLVIGAPSIMVGILLAGLYDKVYNIILEKTVIIANLSRALVVGIGLVAFHLVWIYIGSALFLQNTNFIECWEWFSVLMD